MRELLISLLLSICLIQAAWSQDAPQLIRRYGGEAESLYRVRAALLRREGVAVLTSPEPTVHLFAAERYRSWGREGGGPAELRDPVDLAWSAGTIFVLDQNQKKIISFGEDGRFLSSRSLNGEWANRLYVVGTDTIVGTFVPMGGEHAVIRLNGGDRRDTIFTYGEVAQQIRLEAAGAPSLTLPSPYTPSTVWTVLPNGSTAAWRPEESAIRFIDRRGAEVGRIREVGQSWPVTRADRELWFEDEIPNEFMGRRGIFEPLRRKAREVVTFPDRFPSVLELIGDSGGGVWIRKTTAGSGQVWMLVDKSGAVRGTLRFPAGRTMLAAGEGGLAALAHDELGTESIELYARPSWAK